MHVDNLVRMVNRIGAFFSAMPDRQEALDGIAEHIRRFWEPRMRRELMAHVDAGGDGIDPIVAEAIHKHRTLLEFGLALKDPLPLGGDAG